MEIIAYAIFNKLKSECWTYNDRFYTMAWVHTQSGRRGVHFLFIRCTARALLQLNKLMRFFHFRSVNVFHNLNNDVS